MAITTLKGHVSRAMNFYNMESIWFVVGHGDEWPEGDDYPPVPRNTDSIAEPLGYKKVESKFLCRPVSGPDEHGEITYRGTSWKIIEKDNAPDEGARWVYLMTNIAYDELPTNIVYRQMGVVTGLKPITDKEGEVALQPEDVEEEGLLEVLDNREPVYRDVNQREQLSVIMEF